jgi:hypothetical protein
LGGSGFRVQGSALALSIEAADLIEKEIMKKRITNIEQGMLNIEVMYSVYFRKD